MIIAICDDDRTWIKHAAQLIKNYARKNDLSLELLCFESGKELLSCREKPIGAVFLDVELRGENGIEIARDINEQWKNCQIVYCTDYLHYAIDIYETKHVYFLVKSYLEERLSHIMKKLIHIWSLEKKEVYYHVICGEMTRFLVKDILYFERQTRYTQLVTLDGSYRIREKITQVMDHLPQGMFTRSHSSYTVNLDQVDKKAGNTYEMKNGEKIPISRSFSQSTKDDYLRWCAQQMN